MQNVVIGAVIWSNDGVICLRKNMQLSLEELKHPMS